MWERARLKWEAKQVLRRNYWMPLLVTFVAGLLGAGPSAGGGSAGGAGAGFSAQNDVNITIPHDVPPDAQSSLEEGVAYFGELLSEFFANAAISAVFLLTFALMFVSALALGFAVYAFLTGPVTVGLKRYFMENRGWNADFARLFWGFTNGNYLNGVKIHFMMQLRITLWSLLFIIPGIVKSYEYRMIPYILAENPGIGMERAFQLSRQMTDGEKWRIFVLDLSFIGWILLGVLTCCIGGYFLSPYIEATEAELYEVLREKAFAYAFSNPQELPGFAPPFGVAPPPQGGYGG